MTDIEKLKEIFLTDVDEETKADNLARIEEWQTALIQSEEIASWLEHDVTKKIIAQAHTTNADLAYALATDRTLTDDKRQSLYARQDAMQWLFSLADHDPIAARKQIEGEIKRALAASS